MEFSEVILDYLFVPHLNLTKMFKFHSFLSMILKWALNNHDQLCRQGDFEKIHEWSSLNETKLNCNKCKVLSIVRCKFDRIMYFAPMGLSSEVRYS